MSLSASMLPSAGLMSRHDQAILTWPCRISHLNHSQRNRVLDSRPAFRAWSLERCANCSIYHKRVHTSSTQVANHETPCNKCCNVPRITSFASCNCFSVFLLKRCFFRFCLYKFKAVVEFLPATTLHLQACAVLYSGTAKLRQINCLGDLSLAGLSVLLGLLL